MSAFTLPRLRKLTFGLIIVMFIGVVGWAISSLVSNYFHFQSPTILSPLQKVTIGQPISKQSLSNLPGIKEKTATGSATTSYTYNSFLPLHSSEIVGENNAAVFERIVTPQDPAEPGYVTVSEMKQQYGEPERVITGSKSYGWFINTYIYASKGFAFVANPNTEVVMEIQHFAPTTVDEYKQKFGQDLAEGVAPRGL
jgi:hypothetical protein